MVRPSPLPHIRALSEGWFAKSWKWLTEGSNGIDLVNFIIAVTSLMLSLAVALPALASMRSPTVVIVGISHIESGSEKPGRTECTIRNEKGRVVHIEGVYLILGHPGSLPNEPPKWDSKREVRLWPDRIGVPCVIVDGPDAGRSPSGLHLAAGESLEVEASIERLAYQIDTAICPRIEVFSNGKVIATADIPSVSLDRMKRDAMAQRAAAQRGIHK